MARKLRSAAGGLVYHVLNRAVGRGILFEDDGDFAAFEKVLGEMVERTKMRLLAYCQMSNHWHLILWPKEDGDLSTFMRLLTVTHVRRWHAHRGTAGTGPLYQGRFKSFPIQASARSDSRAADRYFLTACRYVERNPLRAGRVKRIADWKWSSLWRRLNATAQTPWLVPQDHWPAEVPREMRPWEQFVQKAETAAELAALQRCLRRGAPYGGAGWVARTARRLNLESSLRPTHRPKRRKRGMEQKKDS